MLRLLNFKGLLIKAALVAAVIGVAYWYFTYSQNKIQSLTAENASLRVAIDSQHKTIKALQDFSIKQTKDIRELQDSLADAEEENQKLEEMFSNQNLEEKSRINPEIVEKELNDASKKAIQGIIDLTTRGR